MSHPGDAEFVFELCVCRWAELAWPPAGERTPVVVARQLGTRERRWDTVVVEADPDGLAARRAFGPRTLDSDLLHVVRHAPAEWTWYRDALPDPGYPWRYVRAAVHRAAARDVVEERRRGNRIEIRRVAPYPSWVHRLVAIENKPDLDAAAARALRDQLVHDVERGLADEVWVATAATGAAVEPALLEDLPVEAGILALDFADGVDPAAAEVLWQPTRLARAAAGAGPGRNADASSGVDRPDPVAADPADETAASDPADETAASDRTTRLELAERAYGRGWRSYAGTMRPDCRWFELRRHGRALLPWCGAKERHQSGAECSGSCPAFEPEPPRWRTGGWPIDGGPGKGASRLLDRRRDRVRERQRREP